MPTFSRFRQLYLAYAAASAGVVALAQVVVFVWHRELFPAFLIATGMLLVLALGIVYLVFRQVVQPLTRMTQDAQAIVSGDYAPLSAPEEHGQLGELGAAFNQMQQELSQRVNQMREYNERLGTVLGSMAEGVLAVDSAQRVLLANDASARLLDFVNRNVLGRSLIEVCRHPAVREAVETALQNTEPFSAEFEMPGSQRRVLSLRATRLPGKPSPGVVLVLHDVTELRRLENLRREFVANVSHELKTPLSSIKAYAETLRLGAIGDPENNLLFVQHIEEQAERLHELILDLIQLARIESGQMAYDIQEVPLADVVDVSMAHYANAAAARQVRLVAESPPTPLLVRADEEGLTTILDNLVDNAIKYTPQGGSVTVRWRAEGAEAVLEVTDTGIGIAPKDQARVFERFYRVDKARSRELGGTGLGLSIVKHLSQAFGGSAGLDSALGKGTTVHVRVPLVTTES